MQSYTIASEEGAQRYGSEIGKTVSLDLDEDLERALVCAGWIEPVKKQPKEAK